MIHEFNPVIYPTRVWVARSTVSIEEIEKIFDAITGDGYGVPFRSKYTTLLEATSDASTFIVGHKEKNVTGCLVIISDEVMTKTLSHEACHCADYLFETIGDTERTYDHGEPYAYYQSWVFDCLFNVREDENIPLHDTAL